MKIFIFEDDRDTQVFFKFLLGKRYDIEFCDSAEGFYDSVKSSQCDLIMMDIKLKGDEDGIKLTRELKHSSAYRSVPVLCLSAYVFDDYKQKAFSAGADYFLTKPVENGILINTIEMLLNKNKVYMSTSV